MKTLKYEIHVTKDQEHNDFYIVYYFGRKLFSTWYFDELMELLKECIELENDKDKL